MVVGREFMPLKLARSSHEQKQTCLFKHRKLNGITGRMRYGSYFAVDRIAAKLQT